MMLGYSQTRSSGSLTRRRRLFHPRRRRRGLRVLPRRNLHAILRCRLCPNRHRHLRQPHQSLRCQGPRHRIRRRRPPPRRFHRCRVGLAGPSYTTSMNNSATPVCRTISHRQGSLCTCSTALAMLCGLGCRARIYPAPNTLIVLQHLSSTLATRMFTQAVLEGGRKVAEVAL
jgi:hypothetical protein